MAISHLYHHVNLSAKFGLHEGCFAELPTHQDYQQAKALYGNSDHWLKLDIQPEIELIATNQGNEFCISVPMLGFTDPALDYALIPLFALPISINNLIALEKNPGLSRAKVYARDIVNNVYPLLTSPQGTIDYDLIQAAFVGKQLFSPLKEITYIYTKQQLINAQGLQSLPTKTQPLLEMILMKLGCPFALTLSVKDKNQKVLSERTIHIERHAISLPRGQLIALWQNEGVANNLHIHYKTSQSKTFQECFRARVDFDIPMQDGVEYCWKELGSFVSKNNKILRFTHYFGLSRNAFKAIVRCIIPFEDFKTMILQQKRAEKKGLLNCYDQCPVAITNLYDYLLEGVVEQSIPLYAMTNYFVQAEKIHFEMQKLDLAAFDKHDRFVIKQLYQLKNNSNGAESLIDEIDRLLSLRYQTIESNFIVQTIGDKILSSQTIIGATLHLDSYRGETYTVACQTPVHVLNNNKIESVANDALFTPKLPSSVGAVYKVSLASLAQGADVIEDFNWRANDKINLSELLNALSENASSSSVVHARITPNGDTEIWVEQFSKTSQPINYHIATLKGVSSRHGNLPGDINTFIEFRN